MTKVDREIMKLEKEIDRVREDSKINHILHLILSILTGGVWVIVWFIIALTNDVTGKVKKLEKQIDKLEETE